MEAELGAAESSSAAAGERSNEFVWVQRCSGRVAVACGTVTTANGLAAERGGAGGCDSRRRWQCRRDSGGSLCTEVRRSAGPGGDGRAAAGVGCGSGRRCADAATAGETAAAVVGCGSGGESREGGSRRWACGRAATAVRKCGSGGGRAATPPRPAVDRPSQVGSVASAGAVGLEPV
jgi:hypothetical protein